MKKYMNKYMTKNYTLFGKEPEKQDRLTKSLRKIIKAPVLQYLVFAILMSIVGYLCTEKILPYSWQSSLATTFASAIAAIGFCLLMGYSGLASLGTGGFIGIGTYAVHYVMVEAGLPFVVALAAAILIAVAIGLIVGFISLRIEGIYLVILTLALSEILRTLYGAVQAKISVTQRVINILGIDLQRRTSMLMIVSIFLFIVMTITTNLINSPTGRAMLAMKNSTAAAQAMGISLIKYRLMAFIICTVYAALAGALWLLILPVDALEAASPYSLLTSLNILAAVIVGGYKSIWGTIVGTFILCGGFDIVVLQNEAVKSFLATAIPGIDSNTIIYVLQGVLVIIIVMFYPGGLAQLLVELKTKLKALSKKMKEAKYGKDLG